jgi:hypothetical protein
MHPRFGIHFGAKVLERERVVSASKRVSNHNHALRTPERFECGEIRATVSHVIVFGK